MDIQEKEGRVAQLLWTFESRGLFTLSRCAERIDDGKITTRQKAALCEQMTGGDSGLSRIVFLPKKERAFFMLTPTPVLSEHVHHLRRHQINFHTNNFIHDKISKCCQQICCLMLLLW